MYLYSFDNGADIQQLAQSCTDVIHEGHINIVTQARQYGKVVVGVLTECTSIALTMGRISSSWRSLFLLYSGIAALSFKRASIRFTFSLYVGDTGGLTEHFVYTVRTLERMGVSAVIIEDKTGLKKKKARSQ